MALLVVAHKITCETMPAPGHRGINSQALRLHRKRRLSPSVLQYQKHTHKQFGAADAAWWELPRQLSTQHPNKVVVNQLIALPVVGGRISRYTWKRAGRFPKAYYSGNGGKDEASRFTLYVPREKL